MYTSIININKRLNKYKMNHKIYGTMFIYTYIATNKDNETNS